MCWFSLVSILLCWCCSNSYHIAHSIIDLAIFGGTTMSTENPWNNRYEILSRRKDKLHCVLWYVFLTILHFASGTIKQIIFGLLKINLSNIWISQQKHVSNELKQNDDKARFFEGVLLFLCSDSFLWCSLATFSLLFWMT